jgi:DNA-binding NarL/FixJ family response regulator
MLANGFSPRRGHGQAPLLAADRGGGPGAAHSAARILIVEDDFFVATNLEYSLQQAGYEVVGVAVSAAEAEDMARDTHPALVVMDIRLAGGSDGVDAAIKLWADYRIRSIFASAHGDTLTRERAAKAEPLGWVSKPYTAETMITAIRTALAGPDEGPPS